MMKNVKNVDTVVIDGVRFVKEGALAATENKMPVVKNCYFSDDRTIVLWDDGTKTVVQCQPGDQFDPEKGIFAAIAKRAYGNTGKFNDVMRTANDMGEYNFIKEMAKNPDAVTKLIEDLFYGLANSDEEDDEDDVCDKSLPSAQPEQLTDKEQRIFLAAMDREEKVCKQVDEECRDCREPYEDSLVRVCHEIIRKVKGALWMI